MTDFAIWNIIPIQTWQSAPEAIEAFFQMEADKHGLNLSDAEREIQFVYNQIDKEDPTKGIGIPVPTEEGANAVRIVYKWDQ